MDPSPATADYAAADLMALTRHLEHGATTSENLVASLRTRVAEIDTAGPTLRSIIEVADDLEAVARQYDAERNAGRLRGPLHGIPVLVKDNFDTADGMLTTSGSLALTDTRPVADAPTVARLRAAGAIIAGKANLSEWANFRSTHASSGWSGRGGLVRNPHVLDRSAGGSSSGSGAAVAAGLAPVALGTETDGSITCPAALCGVVGIKPTVGLTSRSGVIPVSSSQDSVGPLTRSVRDAALILSVIAGADPADAATRGAPTNVDYLAGLDAGVRGLRIGVARTTGWGEDTAGDALAEQAIAALSTLGAVVVDNANLPSAQFLFESGDEMVVLMTEFKVGVEAYLAGRPDGSPRTLAELIAFNLEHADLELPHFGQEVFESAQETNGLEDPVYLDALARCRRAGREEGIDAALRTHQVDVLVAPTFPRAWSTDLVNGDPDAVTGSSTPAAVAGYPVLSVPIGVVGALPIGLAVFGTSWSEPILLRVAAALEQTLGAAQPPAYLPTQ
ncbi:MAG: amidase [Frankiales bacterium]|jgi:amidase|nr:amidase [Frankiales bacterium]